MSEKYGVCSFCGQTNMNYPVSDQQAKEKADSLATSSCGCAKAKISKTSKDKLVIMRSCTLTNSSEV